MIKDEHYLSNKKNLLSVLTLGPLDNFFSYSISSLLFLKFIFSKSGFIRAFFFLKGLVHRKNVHALYTHIRVMRCAKI